MSLDANGDHVMADSSVLATTEINGRLPETLNPNQTVLNGRSQDLAYDIENASTATNGANGIHDPTAVPDGDGKDVKVVPKSSLTSPLPYVASRTGLVYDVRMRFHVEPIPRDDDMHPEDPRRIFEVYKELRDAGLLEDPSKLELAGNLLLLRIPIRSATRAEIVACHTVEHFEFVMSLKDMDDAELERLGRPDISDSVYFSINTPSCALLAAGGAIEAARAVMKNQVKNSIAVIRPPGHHAEHDHAMGFCFFNNVPVAARAIQDEFGDVARKILILDWDVHHGNGVQNIFYEDPNVLYISLHVDQNGAFYPMGPEKNHLHCGKGAGVGLNVNIPWKTAGMGDGDYIYAFQQVVMPIAQDFDPDLVFVCAGFDAAEGDMIGGCHVTPAGYAHMTHMLMSLAKGKVVVCMEGGYNLRSIAVSALAVTRTLMGEQPDRLQNFQPSPAGVETVQTVVRQQSQYWPCLYPKNPAQRLKRLKGEKLHDIVREWQEDRLFKSYSMTPLFIARTKLSRSYQSQVLATPDYHEAKTLLLIFHDPPEIMTNSDGQTQASTPENMYLTDGIKDYIDWSVEHGVAVIDANIPKHISKSEDDFENVQADSQAERAKEALALATYLWENYIELGEAKNIFIMGVGAAYSSIIELIKTHERIAERITNIFFFISEQTLHSCRSATDEYLSQWYYEASRVYIAQNHQVWAPNQKKPKKRFGKLFQSPSIPIQDMLADHHDEVMEVIAGYLPDEEDAMDEDEVDGKGVGIESEDELSTPKVKKTLPAATPISPERLPPVGNFAISPRGRRSPSKTQH